MQYIPCLFHKPIAIFNCMTVDCAFMVLTKKKKILIVEINLGLQLHKPKRETNCTSLAESLTNTEPFIVVEELQFFTIIIQH